MYVTYMSSCFIRISRPQSYWVVQSTRNGGHARVRMYSTYVHWRRGRGLGGRPCLRQGIPVVGLRLIMCGFSTAGEEGIERKQGQRVACE